MFISNDYLSFFLNFIRWIAALIVILGHLRSLLFVSYEHIENNNIFIKFFYLITSLGHEAVIVFFVLSGYLVGGQVINHIHKKIFSWKIFLIKRISRLYVVLIPTLLITFIFDYIGSTFYNDNGLYNNIFHLSSLNYNVIERLSLWIFSNNIFMLQSSIVPTFGSNGPLWSLAYEFWYYVLFPCLLIISIFKNNLFQNLIYILLIICLFFILNTQILIYFSIWGMGAFSFLITKKILLKYLSILMLFIVIIFIKINSLQVIFINDIILAISIILLINSYRFSTFKFKYVKVNSLLADFSYTLYLTHFPFLLFLVSMSLHYFHYGLYLQPNIFSIFYFLFLLILSYSFAYIIYCLFEKRTNTIKNFLLKVLK